MMEWKVMQDAEPHRGLFPLEVCPFVLALPICELAILLPVLVLCSEVS